MERLKQKPGSPPQQSCALFQDSQCSRQVRRISRRAEDRRVLDYRSSLGSAYATQAVFPNLPRLSTVEVCIRHSGFVISRFRKVLCLRLVVESDLAFLPVLLFGFTRK